MLPPELELRPGYKSRRSAFFNQGQLRADAVEKLQNFQPGQTVSVLSFLSIQMHGGDHVYRDQFLE